MKANQRIKREINQQLKMRQLKKSLKKHGNEDMLDSVGFKNNFKLVKSDTLVIERTEPVNIEEIESNIDAMFSKLMKPRTKRFNTINKDKGHSSKKPERHRKCRKENQLRVETPPIE
jgi:hypothetical protein